MNEDEGSILWGLLMCWGLNILTILIGLLPLGTGLNDNSSSLSVTIVLIGGIGLIQLVYVVPLYLSFKKQGKTETGKGLIIAASITALLNATCWGMFLGH